MKIISIKNITLGIALAAITFTASAQTKYSEGVITYNVNTAGQDNEAKCYFKSDSSAYIIQQGPAKVTLMSNVKNDFFIVLVDVPVVNIKKAAVANPGELEEGASMIPEYTYTATGETKMIGTYNCKKYTAKDTKANTTTDIWTTTDVSMPVNVITKGYATAPGTPIMFTVVQQGVTQIYTIKAVSDAKVPANTFKVPSDYDKITMDDLKTMRGGH